MKKTLKILLFLVSLIYLILPKVALAAPIDLRNFYFFGFLTSLSQLLEILVPVFFVAAGLILLFYLILAAFKWLTSGGDRDELAKARAMLTHSVVGFLLLMLIFLIIQFLPEAIGLKGFQIIK